MIAVDLPPSHLRNSDVVYVESLLEGTTAHLLFCPEVRRPTQAITAVEAWVHLHAQWCPKCMGRRG